MDDNEWIGNRHAVGIGWGRELVRGKKMYFSKYDIMV